MTEEIGQEVRNRDKNIYGSLLQHMQQWWALIEEHGPDYSILEYGDDSFCYYNLLDGMDTLTDVQRRSVELVYVQDMRDTDAAIAMGSPKAPVRQYAEIGLEKLVRFHRAQNTGEDLPKPKSLPLTRKVTR